MGATEGEHGCDHSTDGTPAKNLNLFLPCRIYLNAA
jgi:hypothetical protein